MTHEEIIAAVESMTVLELADLVKAMEEKFGVSAAAPVAVVAGGAGAAAPAEEEKTEFDVVLKEAGSEKIKVIKVVREVVEGLGLKEAKEMVEAAPKTIKEGVSKEEAEKIVEKFKAAGATCEINVYAEDSYGDGWNGAILEVKQNGFAIANYTMASQSKILRFAIPAREAIFGAIWGSLPARRSRPSVLRRA